ncbi:MAG: asparagine synthase-related protein [Rhodospirillaceae bacterium]
MLAVLFDPGRGVRLEGGIAGSIRLDARDELIAALGLGDKSIGDAALCLEAWRRWGGSFVERLAGDFAFALWDEAQQRLLLTRDQLGIRSLFYARIGTAWVVSDSLDWIAARPGLDKRLDETWIGDFLATGHSLDPWRTVYAAVKRLPPGHCAALTRDGESVRRYWQLTVGEPLFLRDGRAYGERLRELTKAAIRDRAPAGKLGISMSGGLDSTTLAALSVEALGDAARVTARCSHFETLMADDEPRFASLIAESLGIALGFDKADAAYDPRWRERGIRTSEPTPAIVNAYREQVLARSMADEASVWFFGEGPDNALAFEREAYLGWLLRTGRWAQAASALWRYVGLKLGEREPRPQPSLAPPPVLSELPRWLRPDFVERTGLRARVRAFQSPPHDHPWRPRAIGSFGTPAWQALLGGLEADRAHGLDWRHPYLDLRVLQFLLSVPPVPWARRKLVMREAMRGRLPAEVLERRKTPLAANALHQALSGVDLPPLAASAALEPWLDPEQLPRRPHAADLESLIAAHALDQWLS